VLLRPKETEISKQELQLIDKEAKIEKQKQFITIAIVFIIIINCIFFFDLLPVQTEDKSQYFN
jgi:hypothetical protein